jgi:hypothetical protein
MFPNIRTILLQVTLVVWPGYCDTTPTCLMIHVCLWKSHASFCFVRITLYVLERFWCKYLLDTLFTRSCSYDTNAHAWLYCITYSMVTCHCSLGFSWKPGDGCHWLLITYVSQPSSNWKKKPHAISVLNKLQPIKVRFTGTILQAACRSMSCLNRGGWPHLHP